MQTIFVEQNHNNKRIDTVLKDIFTSLPANSLYKAFRKKDIKVNGKRVKMDYIVHYGDEISVYISDDILLQRATSLALKKSDIIYEDTNLIVINKKQGLAVHPDKYQFENTLIDIVRHYLFSHLDNCYCENKEVYLCHRLDRNTGGLVLLAKNIPAREVILKKMQSQELQKYYLCWVFGRMNKPEEELTAYLRKDSANSKVFISDIEKDDFDKIITRYKLISEKSCFINGKKEYLSQLEVSLLSGRTHQIRAHLAHIGHPIAGDGKYGLNSLNKALDLKYQALWAYKIIFNFTNKKSTILDYMSPITLEVAPNYEI